MRKFLVLVATAFVAALALASPASADRAVEVVNEATSAHCNVGAANCTAHATNEGLVELRGHIIGIEAHSQDCNNEYDLNVGENGSGNISGFAFTPGNSTCSNVTACSTPWQFTAEETGPSRGELQVQACVTGTPLGTCSGTIDIGLNDLGNHDYEAFAVDQRMNAGIGQCEVTGHWVLESSNFVINHL